MPLVRAPLTWAPAAAAAAAVTLQYGTVGQAFSSLKHLCGNGKTPRPHELHTLLDL